MEQVMTSKQIQVVLDNFAKVLPIANEHGRLLNMRNGELCHVDFKNNTCDTPMCHGGWYATAVKKTRPNDYWDGAMAMAGHLGFECEVGELIRWAKRNPVLWGNQEGINMFDSKMAFYHKTKRPEGALSLQHIVDHWREVKARVEGIEKEAANVN